jgi:hypothetical protein
MVSASNMEDPLQIPASGRPSLIPGWVASDEISGIVQRIFLHFCILPNQSPSQTCVVATRGIVVLLDHLFLICPSGLILLWIELNLWNAF